MATNFTQQLDQAKLTAKFEDNQGVIEHTKNPSHHLRTIHIDIKLNHVGDALL